MELGPQNLMYFGNPWQLLLVLLVVMILFGGRGKISEFMGDFAKGIKAFKRGLSEDEPAQAATPPKPLEHENRQADAKPKEPHETKV